MPKHRHAFLVFLALLFAVFYASNAAAQNPPPPPGWTGSAGAGLSITSGNNDTSVINASYDLKRDAGGPLIITSAGLFLYGKSQDVLTSDRLSLDGRVERKFSERTSIFGQAQYLRDEFKTIDFLLAPTAGFSHQFLKNERTEFALDAGAGGVWEKNPERGTDFDGALTAGQKFSHKITATTELLQRVAALWKMDDLEDALYTFGAGIAASITSATQLKVEVLDTYKARPEPGVLKNDVATLVSFVYKFD